jgi:IS30 family transposase
MYKQLTCEERHYIAIQLRQQISKNKIAEQLGRSHTTITREIARNTGGSGYRYKQAHVFARQRHELKNKATKLTDEIKKIIAKYIKLDWSPEQVCGRLNKEDIISLHHETVYRYVLKNKHRGAFMMRIYSLIYPDAGL